MQIFLFHGNSDVFFLLFLFVFPGIASDMQSGSFQKEPVSVCETAVILDS